MKHSFLYCAIIADIKDSTKMDTIHRKNVQENLMIKLDEMNRTYNDKLASKIDFSRGDQIQALFYSPKEAYSFACMLRDTLYPVCFRIGLGVGDWSLKMEGSSTNAQDGTSYRNAAIAFKRAHEEDKGIVFFSGKKSDALVNVLIANENRIFNNQTDVQKKIAKLYSLSSPIGAEIKKDSFGIDSVFYEKGSQKVIAEQMQKTKQDISQQFMRARLYDQRELKAAVIALLNEYYAERG